MADTSITPGTESICRAFRAAEQEDAFWREHYDDYLKQYPDQFVAVARDSGRFVAADPDLDRLIDTINANGLTVHQVWVRFMVATPIRLIL